MDRHRRMAHTLGCLVASMTVGAILLHVVQPKPDRPAAVPALELVAVTQEWQSIQVEPARPDGRIDPAQTHFFVDRDGRCSDTETWRTQKHVGQPGIIHIAIQPTGNANKVTGAQWNTTKLLVGDLEQKCRIPNKRVILSKGLAPPAPARPQASARTSAGSTGSARSR
jgi:hypothetical protein